MFCPGGGTAFPGLDAPSQRFKGLRWHLRQPPSTTNSCTLGLRGFFTSVRTSTGSAVSQGPLPLVRSPGSRLLQPWGPQGLVDLLNLGGNEPLLSEPSVGAPLCRGGLWEPDKDKSMALSACSGKVTAGKETQPAASPPCRNHQPRVLGACFEIRTSFCTSLHSPWPAQMHRCSGVPTKSSMCWGTCACTVCCAQGRSGAWDPKNIHRSQQSSLDRAGSCAKVVVGRAAAHPLQGVTGRDR